MKKRLLAAVLTACLVLGLTPAWALAAGHRFQRTSDDPYDDWVCADCGAVITPDLKEGYDAVLTQDRKTLPAGVEQTEQAILSYVQRLTEETLEQVGMYSSAVDRVSYAAPNAYYDGEFRYTVTIQSYARLRPLANITTEPLTLVIPRREALWPGFPGPDSSGQPEPEPEPDTAAKQRSELERLLWFAWLARRYAIMPFTDVTREHWAYAGVNYVWRNNLMSGTSDTLFDPDTPATRADVWAVLARMSGYRRQAGQDEPWYAPSMSWAVRQGLTDGSDPLGALTREDLAVMLWRRANGPLTPADLTRFGDRDSVSPYAQNAVSWAVSRGIIQGSDGLLVPRAAVSRAELATMVMRCAPDSYA